MIEQTKLQPKQVMFLKYLLTHGKYLTPFNIRCIEFSLKTGDYITNGPSSVLFNRLRDRYMKGFVKFEEQDYVAFMD